MEEKNSLSNVNFIIHEASFTTVGNEWEKVVAVYPFNRIYLITDGEAEIQLKNHTIKLEKGYLYFLPSYQVVSSKLIKPLSHYYMHFISESPGAMSDLTECYSFCEKVKADEMTESIFKIAMINRFPEDISQKLQLDMALRFFISKLIISNSEMRSFNDKIQKSLEYINENIEKDISVEEIAADAGYNRSYYCSLFKKNFKCAPKTYILEKKLKRAQQLLVNTRLSISEISEKLNFNNNMYFSRLFKQKTGMTPSEYRNQSIK